MAREVVEGSESLIRKLREIHAKVFPQALSRAVNRVAATVKSRGAKDIARATGLKVGTVRRRVVIRKRASQHDPRAVIEITGRPLNLVEFVSGRREPRSPRIGITARPWGQRRKFPGVFLARMPNGEVIAVRRSAAGKSRSKLIRTGRWAGKSPHIEAVWGPGIAKEAAGPILTEARRRIVAERMPIELKHEIRHRIARLYARSKR